MQWNYFKDFEERKFIKKKLTEYFSTSRSFLNSQQYFNDLAKTMEADVFNYQYWVKLYYDIKTERVDIALTKRDNGQKFFFIGNQK